METAAQELEWAEAQKIAVGPDLIPAAQQQLRFLAAVDKRRYLYEGPLLLRAIRRYERCWLPLLAKVGEPGTAIDGPLFVPLDCEWIWHCHRLNPVQYKKDCEELCGRTLDCQNVKSTVGRDPGHMKTESWSRLYPEEPFEFDPDVCCSDGVPHQSSPSAGALKYDLVAAVKRQSSFYYQVSRPTMHDDRFLKKAVARYKGFLHLIKKNREKSIKRFCVPTYDIDLIWHSHQLHPVSYCNDMIRLLGKVLEHDDTDSDRSKGKKLDIGFSETTAQWEETFNSRYWRAGAMHRGSIPSLLAVAPFKFTDGTRIPPKRYSEFELPKRNVIEVLLEVVSVKNMPVGHKGTLFASFCKKHPDHFLSGSSRLNIQSESGEKQVAAFLCEPTGDLILNLVSESPSNSLMSRSAKIIGTTSISLETLKGPNSELAIEKWFTLEVSSKFLGTKPIYLYAAASCTVPVLGSNVFHLIKSHAFAGQMCLPLFPGKVLHHFWSNVADDRGNELIDIKMRHVKKKGIKNTTLKQVVCLSQGSFKPKVLAELTENMWNLLDTKISLSLEKSINEDGHIFEFTGAYPMRLYCGRKLDFEPKTCKCQKKDELEFITVVEFTVDHPYGKALALINIRSGLLKVNDDWFVMPGIVLAFILSDMLKNEGYDAFVPGTENIRDIHTERKDGSFDIIVKQPPSNLALEEAAEVKVADMSNGETAGCCSGCGSSCGSGCGCRFGNALIADAMPMNAEQSIEHSDLRQNSGKGSCGGGNCGGCRGGGGCGNIAKSSACGGGCSGVCGGGGCGKIAKSSACGGGCSGVCGGGGCGNMAKSSACGGGCSGVCGGGCGNQLANNTIVTEVIVTS